MAGLFSNSRIKPIPKYRVYGIITGDKFLGEYEAETEDQAKQQAEGEAFINLCHHCSKEIDGAEIQELQIELVEDKNE